MKKIIFLITSAILTENYFAQPAFVWAKQMGGATTDLGISIAVDGGGNVFTAGWFQGTADFDPGAPVSNMTAIGTTDLFVNKIDASGNLVWAKQMGGTSSTCRVTYGSGMTIDATGNIYITGQFKGTVDFDPGAATFSLTSTGSSISASNIFVCKLDASGGFVWAKKLEGGNNNNEGSSIAIDNTNGNVYTAGFFGGTVDFNPGVGLFSLNGGSWGSGFVSALDASGNFIWAMMINGGGDYAHGVAVDGSSNIYIVGHYGGTTADFDPGAAVYNLPFTGRTFALKLDALGNFVWAKELSNNTGSYNDALAIAVNGNNVYFTGTLTGTADFDPSGGIFNMTGSSWPDADTWVSKFDLSGNFAWARSFRSTSGGDYNPSTAIKIDAAGNVYTTGSFGGTVDFDPGAGNYPLTSAGNSDAFVSILDSLGNFVCAGRMGGSSLDSPQSIAVQGSDIYITGGFIDVADFDPGAGNYPLTSLAVGWDIFISKLMSCSTILNVNIIPTNINCGGQCSGGSTVTPSGGTTPYTYSWSSLQTTASVIGLCAGNYTVTVTDASGKFKTTTTTITQPPVLAANIPSSINATCNLLCNGSATASATGGIPGYTYSWTAGGQTAANATGLCIGTYTVTATDLNGCTSTKTVVLTQPAELTIATDSTQAGCTTTIGTATANPTGGTSGYTYSWNNGQSTQTATGLGAGTYIVTVTDVNGCTKTADVTVTSSSGLSTNILSQANVLCKGGTGTATVSATGGTSPYTYTWSPVGGAGATATGLGAGPYTVTVTDINGCKNSETITITEPTALIIATDSTQTGCTTNTGTVTANPAGGASGYTYSWNNGQTSQTATSLGSGTYTVTVTDANTCTKTATVTVTSSSGLTTTTSSYSNVLCNGALTGIATVSATGGASPYTYAWSATGATATTGSGLSAGIHTVTVTDANGCTSTSTVIITEPVALTIIINTTPTGCTTSTGTATGTPTGGTSPYSYTWSNGGSTSQISNLTSQIYTVTVTDANGCTQTQTVTVGTIAGPTITAIATPVTISTGSSSILTATGGVTYQWLPTTGLSCTTCPTTTASPTLTTTYCVRVTDANGCLDSACVKINVEQPCAKIFVPNAFSPNSDGANELECVMGNCIETFYFVIYDRWGEKVFETTNQKICWDGTYKGELMNTAVFVYYLEATLTTGENITKKGNISLVR